VGFGLIEILIAAAVVSILAAIGIPTYLTFLQKARETALMQYLRALHKGQEMWRAATDSLSYCGDFDELEETGFVPDSQNLVAVRRRAPRSGRVVETSSRLVREHRVDLRAIDDAATGTHTFTVRAYPESRNPRVRWFYMDHTGIIRAAVGWANADAPPVN
jgi:prepilin peptidase dependent protein D